MAVIQKIDTKLSQEVINMYSTVPNPHTLILHTYERNLSNFMSVSTINYNFKGD